MVRLTPEDKNELSALASETGVSVPEAMRHGAYMYYAQVEPKGATPHTMLKSIESATSALSDYIRNQR